MKHEEPKKKISLYFIHINSDNIIKCFMEISLGALVKVILIFRYINKIIDVHNKCKQFQEK